MKEQPCKIYLGTMWFALLEAAYSTSSSVVTSRCHLEQELSKPLHQQWIPPPPQWLGEAEPKNRIYLPDRLGLWAGIPHNLSLEDSGILTTVPCHPANGRCPGRYWPRNDRAAKFSHVLSAAKSRALLLIFKWGTSNRKDEWKTCESTCRADLAALDVCCAFMKENEVIVIRF